MDRNLLLAIALSLVVLSTWSMWEAQQQGPSPETPSPVAIDPAPAPPAPMAAEPAASDVPAAGEPAPAAQEIEIATPLYVARLSSRGAGLIGWRLTQYRVRTGADAPTVELVTPAGQRDIAFATPFPELGVGDLSSVVFDVEQPDPTRVAFTHRARGLTIRKIFDFDPESYRFTLDVSVRNDSGAAVAPDFEVRIPAVVRPGSDFSNESLAAYHDAALVRELVASVGSPGFFRKMTGGGAPEVARYEGDVEWAGVDSHYFLVALVPDQPREAVATFHPLEPGAAAELGVSFRPASVPPGFAAERELRAYVGPKEPTRLEATGSNLQHSIDVGYSWAAPLTNLFTWLLKACHALIPNYGVAIILLTVLVRVVTAPLTARQMKSMKKMGEIQPRLRAIQERFKDDREKQSQEMMKLYREAGVNPLGGCLPILLQFPVFIGLYYALQSSIDLRQAPFVSWIDDLSAPEALFVIPGLELPFRLLPVVMGGSMVLQQRLTPTTMDPAQARMMMTIMPVMFTVMFYQFPSGLVLYWLVSNLLAIAHQVWMNRAAEPAK